MNNKKRAITAILGPESPNVGVRTEDGEPQEQEGLAMAQSLIDAVHSKDAKGVLEAYKALDACCDSTGLEQE